MLQCMEKRGCRPVEGLNTTHHISTAAIPFVGNAVVSSGHVLLAPASCDSPQQMPEPTWCAQPGLEGKRGSPFYPPRCCAGSWQLWHLVQSPGHPQTAWKWLPQSPHCRCSLPTASLAPLGKEIRCTLPGTQPLACLACGSGDKTRVSDVTGGSGVCGANPAFRLTIFPDSLPLGSCHFHHGLDSKWLMWAVNGYILCDKPRDFQAFYRAGFRSC